MMKCNCDKTSAANVAGLNYSLSDTEGNTVVDIWIPTNFLWLSLSVSSGDLKPNSAFMLCHFILSLASKRRDNLQ